MSDAFKEYGHQKSVQEAIEELAVACMMNGMQPPKKITFDRESFTKFNYQMSRSAVTGPYEAEPPVNPNPDDQVFFTTNAGQIEIVEE